MVGFLKTGESPFLGHNPDQGVERVGDRIRIVSSFENGSETAIDLHPKDFADQLRQVENDLKRFLFVLKNWADRTIAAVANDFVGRFDEMFEIGRAGSKPIVNMVIENT